MLDYAASSGLALLVTWIVNAIILVIVDRLRIGLRVRSFGYALLAAAVIAIIGAAVNHLLGFLGVNVAARGLVGFIVAMLVNAFILWLAAQITPGFKIRSYTAAVGVAIVIAAIGWLIRLLPWPGA